MTLTLTVTAYNKATVVASIPGAAARRARTWCSKPRDRSHGERRPARLRGDRRPDRRARERGRRGGDGHHRRAVVDRPASSRIPAGALSLPGHRRPAASAPASRPCRCRDLGEAPDGHVGPVQPSPITAANGVWNATFPRHHPGSGPAVQDVDGRRLRLGDHDGYADPGETVGLDGAASPTPATRRPATLTGLIATCNPYAVAGDPGAATGAAIAAGGHGRPHGFRVQIDGGLPGADRTSPSPSASPTRRALRRGHGCHQFTVGGWYDDFETDRGWTGGVTGDTATGGVWERGDPA